MRPLHVATLLLFVLFLSFPPFVMFPRPNIQVRESENLSSSKNRSRGRSCFQANFCSSASGAFPRPRVSGFFEGASADRGRRLGRHVIGVPVRFVLFLQQGGELLENRVRRRRVLLGRNMMVTAFLLRDFFSDGGHNFAHYIEPSAEIASWGWSMSIHNVANQIAISFLRSRDLALCFFRMMVSSGLADRSSFRFSHEPSRHMFPRPNIQVRESDNFFDTVCVNVAPMRAGEVQELLAHSYGCNVRLVDSTTICVNFDETHSMGDVENLATAIAHIVCLDSSPIEKWFGGTSSSHELSASAEVDAEESVGNHDIRGL